MNMSEHMEKNCLNHYLEVSHSRLIAWRLGAGANSSLRVHASLLERGTAAGGAAGAGEVAAVHLRHVHAQVLKFCPQPWHWSLSLPLLGGTGHHCLASGFVNPGIDGINNLLLPNFLSKPVDLLHCLVFLLNVEFVEAILLAFLLLCLQLL